LLEVDRVGPDDDFFALGGHSLLVVDLVASIERDLGMRPALSTLFDARTPRQLVAALGIGEVGTSAVTSANSGPAGPVVVLRAGAPGIAPLWLMHPAGGNHLLYEPLTARLGPDVPLLGVVAIGVEGEAAPLRRVEDLADHQHHWIRSTQPCGPYRLWGYSVGGLVGFEVARRLLAAGEQVEYFGVLCGGAPGAAPKVLDPGRFEAYIDLVRGGDLSGVPQRFAANIRRRLERQAVARLGVRPSARQIDEDVRLAMVEAFRTYLGGPLDIEVELTMGLDNPDEVIDPLVAAWGRLATGGVTLQRVPGWHDTVLVEPALDDVAALLRRSLGLDADGSGGPHRGR